MLYSRTNIIHRYSFNVYKYTLQWYKSRYVKHVICVCVSLYESMFGLCLITSTKMTPTCLSSHIASTCIYTHYDVLSHFNFINKIDQFRKSTLGRSDGQHAHVLSHQPAIRNSNCTTNALALMCAQASALRLSGFLWSPKIWEKTLSMLNVDRLCMYKYTHNPEHSRSSTARTYQILVPLNSQMECDCWPPTSPNCCSQRTRWSTALGWVHCQRRKHNDAHLSKTWMNQRLHWSLQHTMQKAWQTSAKCTFSKGQIRRQIGLKCGF